MSTSTATSASIKRFQALRMRAAGSSWAEVAESCGESVGLVYSWVRSELRTVQAESRELAEVERDLQLRRLDDLVSVTMKTIGDDPTVDLKAVLVILKIEERRARLLGLDAPEKLQAIVAVGERAAATPADAARIMRGFFGSVTPDAIDV